ncbi:MAG: endonuclease domain-containing protein [Bacteroidia bacterium]
MQANNYNHYNKNLQPFANTNRKQMTKAEACLWKYALRAKQTGYTFNRQRPVLNYIADFMCKDLKLIIEADGYTHTLEEVIKNDLIRQTKLEEAGFTVIRFKDAEILHEINRVKQVILHTMEELKKKVELPKSEL